MVFSAPRISSWPSRYGSNRPDPAKGIGSRIRWVVSPPSAANRNHDGTRQQRQDRADLGRHRREIADEYSAPALAEAKVDIHARECLNIRSLIKTADVDRLKADIADQAGDRFLRAFVVTAEDKARRRC